MSNRTKRTEAERLIVRQERELRRIERAARQAEREQRAALRMERREKRARRIEARANAEATLRMLPVGEEIALCNICGRVKTEASFFVINGDGCGTCYTCQFAADEDEQPVFFFPPAIDDLIQPILDAKSGDPEAIVKHEVTK